MYTKKSSNWLKHADFIILDLICIQISFILAYWVHHGIHNPYRIPYYRNAAVILLLLHFIIVFFTECYKDILRRGIYQEFRSSLAHAVELVVLLSFVLYIMGEGVVFSRITLVLTACLTFLFSFLVRSIWKTHLKKQKQERGRTVLLVCSANSADHILQKLEEHNYEKILVTGIAVTDNKTVNTVAGETSISGVPVVANRETVIDYILANWVDEVLVKMPVAQELSKEGKQFFHKCSEMGVTVHRILGERDDMYERQQFIERIGGFEVLTSTTRLISMRQRFFKRFLDLCGGLVGSVLTLLLLLFIGPVIKIKSPGPIFFTQIRVGKNGKPFKIYKFRSMYVDAEERKAELMKEADSNGLMFKMKDDPRIIKGVGHFIRKYSLDEFPQFFNVLIGDMSLVGTRPPTVDEWNRYALHHRKRLVVKPGLTGMWQVSGRSNITDFEEVVALDMKYINEWTFGMDIKILLKTVKVVLTNEGAV